MSKLILLILLIFLPVTDVVADSGEVGAATWRCPVPPSYTRYDEEASWTDQLRLEARIRGEFVCEKRYGSSHCPLEIMLFASGHMYIHCTELSWETMRRGDRGDLGG